MRRIPWGHLARTAPAMAMTAVSMALTLAVVGEWLTGLLPLALALLVGVGLDGAWLTSLSYERRLAAQGDHSVPVTVIGWTFGAVATGVLVAHALTAPTGGAARLAVARLPQAAQALWLVHGMWERTALTPGALAEIRDVLQQSRDGAAVARARLRAQATTEETRLHAVTAAGARVARVQAKTADQLSGAWTRLEKSRAEEGPARALTCVTTPVTPGVTPRWDLPVWQPVPRLPELSTTAAELSDGDLDRIVTELRDSEHPPLSYREMAMRFRAAGHSAGETRLRGAWRRVNAEGA
jgi:hypothetical protein